MTKPLATQAKKTYVPKRMVGTLQTSFIVGLMRAKGFSSQQYILSVITALSTAKTFGDITFEEAQYLIRRLPDVTKAQIDAYLQDTTTLSEIGLTPFRAFNKYNHKGGKA